MPPGAYSQHPKHTVSNARPVEILQLICVSFSPVLLLFYRCDPGKYPTTETQNVAFSLLMVLIANEHNNSSVSVVYIYVQRICLQQYTCVHLTRTYLKVIANFSATEIRFFTLIDGNF